MTTAFQNNAFQLDAFQIGIVSGYISANDSPDTSNIVGSVTAGVNVYGSISATDQNDSALLQGAVSSASTQDTHDGFTPQDIKRAKELDKRIEKARRKLEEAHRLQKLARKQTIRGLVDPESIVAKKQQSVVESQQITKDSALKQVIKASANLKRIEDQRKALYETIALRQEQARIMTELAILRAKELDEEEAILALLM